MAALASAALAALPPATASADRIDMPRVLERKSGVEFTYLLDAPLATSAGLDIEWTDAEQRLVARKHVRVPAGETAVAFTLDLRRAAVRENMLTVRLLAPARASPVNPRSTSRRVRSLVGLPDHNVAGADAAGL